LQIFRESIEAALASVYYQHIDSAPQDQRGDLSCDFLVALRLGRDFWLFRTNRTMLTEERGYASLGMGLYLSQYALGLLLPSFCTVEVAAQVATYVIAAAKDYTETVGKGTDIHILRGDGLHYGFVVPERREVEQGFDEFFKSLRHVINAVDAGSVSEESVSTYLGFLGDSVRKLREAQAVRIKRRDSQQARLAAAQPAEPTPPSVPGSSNTGE
jgi:hypothetical protein